MMASARPIPIFLTEQELQDDFAKRSFVKRALARVAFVRFLMVCAEMEAPDPKIIVCQQCGRVKKGDRFVDRAKFSAGQFNLVTVVCPECRGVVI